MQLARNAFNGGLLSKQISERFKRRCSHELNRALNAAGIETDINQTRTNYVTALQPTNWNLKPGDIFDSERTRLETAIDGTADEFLKYFPGKPIISKFSSILGLSTDSYVGIVTKSLIAKQQEPLFSVGQQVSTALAEVLPNRQ